MSMQTDTIDVVFAVDEPFLPHLRAAMASMWCHAIDPRRYRVWLVSTAGNDLTKCLRVPDVGRTVPDVRWLPIEPTVLSLAPTSRHISLASYYRILVPAMLPADVIRFVYLDADILVRTDLEPLANAHLGDAILGAVVDGNQPGRRIGTMGPRSRYFNAGVLVIDRARWQAFDTTSRLLGLIAEHAAILECHDQDALNIVLDGWWHELCPSWNQQSAFWERSSKAIGLSSHAHRRALKDPRIVHFTNPNKPWNFDSDHPCRREYERFLRRVGLPLWRPRPRSFAEVLSRAAKLVVPYRCRHLFRGSRP